MHPKLKFLLSAGVNLLQKTILILKISLALSAVAAMPELYLTLTLDRELLEKNIRQTLDSAGVNYTFDGLSVTFYGGIVLHNLNLFPENENHWFDQVTAPEFILSPAFTDRLHGRLGQNTTIVLTNASWHIHLTEKNIKTVKMPVFQWLLDESPFPNVRFKNNQITLVFELKNTGKEKWTIQNINGSATLENGIWKAEFHYEDIPWGEGTLTFQPEHCPACLPWVGEYSVFLHGLPLNRLSWLVPEREITSGFGNLEATILLPGDPKIQKSVSGKLRVENVKTGLTNPATAYSPFSIDTALLDFSARSMEKNLQVEAMGNWNGYAAQFNAEWDPAQSLNRLFFTFENKSDGHSVVLPGGWTLNGIQEIVLDIARDPNKKRRYHIQRGKISLSESRIEPPGKNDLAFFIPRAEVNMEQNQYRLNADLEKGDSLVTLTSSGSIFPEYRDVVIFSRATGGIKKKRYVREVLSFYGTHEASLQIRKWNWNSARPYMETLDEVIGEKVIRGIQEGWKESAVRERRWFQKYFYPTDLDLEITTVPGLQASNETVPGHWEGILSIHNSFAFFEINNKNTDELVKADWSGRDNYPDLNGTVSLRLESSAFPAAFFISPALVSSFSTAKLEYTFYTGGERAGDLFLNYRSRGALEFFDARTPQAGQYENEMWSALSCRFARWGARAEIYEIQGENDRFMLRGSGNWSFDNGKSQWNFRPHIQEKLQ